MRRISEGERARDLGAGHKCDGSSRSDEQVEELALRRLLSPTELAAYLGIPLATVYRWRSRREGPVGLRLGRHVRYRIEDVERWLDSQRQSGA